MIADWNMTAYEELSLDDISKVINKHRYRLIDLMRLYQKKKQGLDLQYTDSKDYTSTNLKILCRNMINKLGFTVNTLYKKEGEILAEKLVSYLKWGTPESKGGRGYTNELLAVCITHIILDHYNVSYNKEELLSLYCLQAKPFLQLYQKCKRWCNANYWK